MASNDDPVTHQHDVRIASLLPSATEILIRLGLTDSIVGVSHECHEIFEEHGFDFHTRHPKVQVLNSSTIDPTAASQGDIDAQVGVLK